MATGPTIPKDPLELLTPDLSRPEPFINKYWGGAMTAGLIWGCSMMVNYTLHKPVFSSLHIQAAFVAGGAIVGQYFDEKRKEYFAEKDAVLRHYIQLHPEDFPARVSKNTLNFFCLGIQLDK
ncbi:NADH dehydrogenase [ubiquinone] 1 subunit C2 [Atheta coriaria]|uniref:NADH dehydrogenase [ubiquinone] 1 subunit C2 n=1 Tax=Dalotia coriaria TaxID=877792 RepID=UPI0031F34DBD